MPTSKPEPVIPENIRYVMKCLGIIAVVLAVIGIILHIAASIHLHFATNRDAVLDVAVTEVRAQPAIEEIVLPGNVQAWHYAPIYARVNGYVKVWHVDIGSLVKQGQLLAELEAPELVAALRQAEADLKTAEANNDLAQSTAKRWLALLKTHSVSKQETDEKVSAAAANLALVNAARANRDRLKDTLQFTLVVAPFDGVISARSTDIGALINAGSGVRPLFKIAQSNPLRVYVRVPQNYSSRINPGMIVDLYFSEHPGKVYQATLLNTADAIDPNTRTLLVQFTVDNTSNELLPGGFTEVHLPFPTNANVVILPVNAFLFRAEGMQVGLVDDKNQVQLKSVKVMRDLGNILEVSDDLKPGQKIIINPSDSLFNGQKVNIVKTIQPKDS